MNRNSQKRSTGAGGITLSAPATFRVTGIMKKRRFAGALQLMAALPLILLLTGCAELMKTMQSITESGVLTEAEITGGLKEALSTGARNAAGRLAATDGYWGDLSVKIPLPDEAAIIVQNIHRIPGGEQLLENLLLSINRAAEDAAKGAAPIFVEAVRQMTISDGYNILHGADNAATGYLRQTTRSELYNLYKPGIASSTKKPLVAGVSAQDTWNSLTGKWNTLANTAAGRIAGFKTVTTELDHFLTGKALDGLFLKMEGEELKIRREVSARITPLLQKVFGSLDRK